MGEDTDKLFEEWDENFLDEVIHVSELATSSSAAAAAVPPPQPPLYTDGRGGGGISYSPPRELSQRVPDDDGDLIKAFQRDSAFNRSSRKDPPFSRFDRNSSRGLSFHGNDRLIKRDSSRAVKQLIPREQSGQQIRKADKKKEPLKPTLPRIELKDADVQHRLFKNLEHQSHTQNLSELTSGFQNGSSVNDQLGSRVTVVTPTCKSIGVQTEKSESPAPLIVKNDTYISQHQRSKLLAVWDSPTRQGSQRDFVTELLVACEKDLGILFGFLSIGTRATTSSLLDQMPQSAEADRVFNLYSMLTKMGSGMVKLDSVVEALVDLCHLDNDVILYRSLRVLHKTLNHTCCLGARSNIRDNVLVERPSSGDNSAGTSGFQFQFDEFSDSSFNALRTCLSEAENIFKNDPGTQRYTLSTSCLDWISIFELICRIAMKTAEECTRLEAVSIMNMILIRSNAYVDRERFGRVMGFQAISLFLRKESGVGVQNEAVHLLYLLLNCPELMAMFCSGCKKEVESDKNVNSEAKNGSAVIEFGAILEGLAACITCDGNSTSELKLRRDTVTLLAFLASSGKLGFEILLAQRILKRSNYLAMILQMLVSETDAESSNTSEPSEIFKERTLLIRETLIFLNRLVSNPQFSAPVLRVLTDSRSTACFAVDIANRLSNKTNFSWQSDSMTRQLRESEIVELARVFRKRVFAYLENGSP